MLDLAYAESNKLTFEEMAKDTLEPVDAVTVLPSEEANVVRLNGIKHLPAAEQVKVYSELAVHFKTMEALAHSDGTKLTFAEMAKDMNERADAVTVFAP
jgi:hypothetical protein